MSYSVERNIRIILVFSWLREIVFQDLSLRVSASNIVEQVLRHNPDKVKAVCILRLETEKEFGWCFFGSIQLEVSLKRYA